jgi:hypothetical protein
MPLAGDHRPTRGCQSSSRSPRLQRLFKYNQLRVRYQDAAGAKQQVKTVVLTSSSGDAGAEWGANELQRARTLANQLHLLSAISQATKRHKHQTFAQLRRKAALTLTALAADFHVVAVELVSSADNTPCTRTALCAVPWNPRRLYASVTEQISAPSAEIVTTQ